VAQRSSDTNCEDQMNNISNLPPQQHSMVSK
jgi:hypothetical protein